MKRTLDEWYEHDLHSLGDYGDVTVGPDWDGPTVYLRAGDEYGGDGAHLTLDDARELIRRLTAAVAEVEREPREKVVLPRGTFSDVLSQPLLDELMQEMRPMNILRPFLRPHGATERH